MVVKEEEERKEGRKGIEEGEGKGMTRKGEEEKERKLRSGRYNFLKVNTVYFMGRHFSFSLSLAISRSVVTYRSIAIPHSPSFSFSRYY